MKPDAKDVRNERTLLKFAFLSLLILSISLLMGKAYDQSLQAMDSSLHARLALDATSHGITPVLPIKNWNGGFTQGFNDHPYTLFYLEGWIMRLFGASAWSARFLPSLFGIGCIGLISWLGALFYSPFHGLVAGLILMASLPFSNYVARFQLDPAMIFFILLSTVGWKKRNPILMGIAAGLGIWMKSVVALLIFPSAFLSLIFQSKLTKKEFMVIVKGSIIALFVGSLIWIHTGYVGGWEIVRDYWFRQVYGTVVQGRNHVIPYDLNSFFLFTEALKRRYWPWLPLLLFSLFQILKNRRWKTPEVALPLAATLMVIFTISAMRFKFDHYYFPMYPFLALLCVDGIRKWIDKKRMTVAKGIISLGLIIPGILLAFPIELSPEMFPALKRFEAIIQSYGTCQDKVLFVEGQQPYGSYGDYSVELAFYTNRPFLSSNCEAANSFIENEKPHWILVSGSNKEQCIGQKAQSIYKTQYRFGNQFLLTDLITPENALDLTPLARELKAPLDCQAVPLPKNRYYKY